LFERQGDIEVTATCTDGTAALDAARRLRPDVLVVDLTMPKLSGLEILKAVAREHLPCRCVLITAAITESEVIEAVTLNAFGLVLKESAPDTLVRCVRAVQGGEQWMDQEALTRGLRSLEAPDTATTAVAALLTPREGEIVRMVAEGLRNRGIAERLGISEGTVKVHLHRIYEKLGVSGRLDLLVVAQRRGLI